MDREYIAGIAAVSAETRNCAVNRVRHRWLLTSTKIILALFFSSGLHLHSYNGHVVLSASEARADSIQYIYDDLGRLVEAVNTTSGQSVQYTYDAVGNITSQLSVSIATLAISNFDPQQGPAGATVTISGTGFSTTPSNNSVTFNGVTAVVQTATQTQLAVIVPPAATSGPISVSVGASTVTTVASFVVTPLGGGPTITGLFPPIGAAGGVVTIVGTNFDPLPANDNVVFDTSFALTSASTLTAIATTVPLNAGSGKVQVTTPLGVAISPMDFIVVPAGYGVTSIGPTGRLPTDGSATNLSLPTAGKINVELFDANAGDLLTIGVTSMSFSTATLKVYEPHGTLLATGAVTGVGQGLQLPKLPRSGTYTVVVDAGSQTGIIGLSIVRPFQAALTLNGAATPVTLSPPGRRALLTFTGAQGTYATVNLSAVTLSAGTLSVLAPNGAVLDSGAFGVAGKILQPQLPTNGIYTVLVEPTGSVGGSLNVAVSASLTPALGINTELGVSLPTTTPVNVTFEAFAGQFLSLGISEFKPNGVAGATFTVLKPDGSTLTTGTFTGTPCAPGSFCTGPWVGDMALSLGTMPQGGTYTIVLQRTGTASGGVILSLSTPATATMTMGSSSFLTVPQSGQAMQFSVAASAGQYVAIAVSEGANTIPAATVTVFGPDGSVLSAGSFTTNCPPVPEQSGCSGTSLLNLGPLEVSGTLTVVVQQTGAGNGTLGIVASNPVAQAVAFGSVVGIPAPLLGQGVAMSFAGTAGQYASLLVSEGSGTIPGARLTVLNPDGSVLATGTFAPTACVGVGCSGYSGGAVVNVGPLAITGDYTLLVQQTTAATGTFFVAVSQPVSSTMTPGTNSAEFTALKGQSLSINFAGTVGQYYSLGVSEAHAGIPGAVITVLAPDGSVLTTGTFAPTCTNGCYSGTGVVNMGPLSIAGTYTVLVQQTGAYDTGGLTFFLSNPVAGALTVGTESDVPASLLGQSMQLTFSGSAGSFYSLASAANNGTIEGANISVLKPDGTLMIKGALSTTPANGRYSGKNLLNFGPLIMSGTYTALVQQTAGDTGTLAFTLTNPAVGTMGAGAPAVIQAPLLGQALQANFAGVAGTSVDLHVQENFGSYIPTAKISVFNPDGTPLANGMFNATTCSGCDGYAGSADVYPTVLPQTGNYMLLLQQTAAATGALTVSGNGIQPLTASTSNFSTTTAGQSVNYSFTATAGQSVSLALTNLSLTPASPNYVYITMTKPDGSYYWSWICYTGAGCEYPFYNLPLTGTYNLTIAPGATSQTMSFTVAMSPDVGEALAVGTAAPVTLDASAQSAVLTFSATAGQTFALNVSGVTTSPANTAIYVYVYNTAGTVIASTSTTTGATLNLSNLAADTYRVLIFPASPATSSMQVILEPGAAGAVPSNGTTASFHTVEPGENAYLTFSATAGQSMSLALTNLSLTPASPNYVYITMTKPDGSYYWSWACYLGAGCEYAFYKLPVTGTYNLTISPGATSQTMSFATTLSVDTTAALSLGAPTAVSLPAMGQSEVMSFTATAGQTLALNVANVVTTPANTSISIIVYNSGGTVIASTTTTTGATLNLPNLAADTYTAFIAPAVPATSTMQVTLDAGVGGGLPSTGITSNFATVAPGQNAYLSFSATAGQSVSLALTNLALSPGSPNYAQITVTTPSGAYYGSWICYLGAGCEYAFYNLPLTGTYNLTISPGASTQTMNFATTLSADAIGALTVGTPFNVNLDTLGESEILNFTATAGETVVLSLSAVSTTPSGTLMYMNVYSSAGTWMAGVSTSTSTTMNLQSLAAGNYQVLIYPAAPVTGTMQVVYH
jgi:large repetitive protein